MVFQTEHYQEDPSNGFYQFLIFLKSVLRRPRPRSGPRSRLRPIEIRNISLNNLHLSSKSSVDFHFLSVQLSLKINLDCDTEIRKLPILNSFF